MPPRARPCVRVREVDAAPGSIDRGRPRPVVAHAAVATDVASGESRAVIGGATCPFATGADEKT